MSEKPKLEVIRGGQDYVMELSQAVQDALKGLPVNFMRLVNNDAVAQKRSEIILYTNKELLEYLQGTDLFRDQDTANFTWAVIEVVKGKITSA